MRPVLILASALLAILVGCPVQCQTADSPAITFGEPQIQYCDANSYLAFAKVHVPVTFSNRTNNKMLLATLLGPREEVSVSDVSGTEIYRPDIQTFVTEKPPAPGKPPESRMFQTIGPGGTAQRQFDFSFQVSKNSAHRVGSTPTPGTYLVSASRPAWPFSDDAPQIIEQTKTAWRRYGTLVTSDVRIKDLRIQITLPENLPSCHSPGGKS